MFSHARRANAATRRNATRNAPRRARTYTGVCAAIAARSVAWPVLEHSQSAAVGTGTSGLVSGTLVSAISSRWIAGAVFAARRGCAVQLGTGAAQSTVDFAVADGESNADVFARRIGCG